jgi:hypothetical protein
MGETEGGMCGATEAEFLRGIGGWQLFLKANAGGIGRFYREVMKRGKGRFGRSGGWGLVRHGGFYPMAPGWEIWCKNAG